MRSVKLKNKQACFVAPEMTLFGTEDPADSPKRDMWSVGVLAYFFITGNLQVDFHESLDFSKPVWQHVSPDAIDLIKSCLILDPQNRISSIDAVNHLWLRKINWLSNQPLLDTFSQISRTASVRVFRSQLNALFFHNNESEQHKLHLKELFEKFDVNKDGTISLAELKEGYNS